MRDTAIGVLGGENRPFTLHQAQLVRQWSDDVVFFPHRIVLTDDERARFDARGIRVVEGEVARLTVAQHRLQGVELVDGRTVARTAVFVGPRFVPRDDVLTALGCVLGENGWVQVEPTGRTSVPGVWAAGNVVDSPAQVASAVGAGASAAISLNHHLLAEDVERALAARSHSVG
ncbi:FAD-dependent oxidoreductase [Pseudonocardia sp. MH-G8]|uniref:FAD-dependent oxidoreductase n=1 Tax=Pseudonocardia sp. MH-G8 TaxID=1854588 RepID=UPI001E4695B3|nr:FAD-dependent oxidoreductase [Pseudonocardia sp. MH-G8]